MTKHARHRLRIECSLYREHNKNNAKPEKSSKRTFKRIFVFINLFYVLSNDNFIKHVSNNYILPKTLHSELILVLAHTSCCQSLCNLAYRIIAARKYIIMPFRPYYLPLIVNVCFIHATINTESTQRKTKHTGNNPCSD